MGQRAMGMRFIVLSITTTSIETVDAF
jgi:hypothetical protein